MSRSVRRINKHTTSYRPDRIGSGYNVNLLQTAAKLFVLVILAVSCGGDAGPVDILRTTECEGREVSPVVFNGILYRFEYVPRSRSEIGESYFRFVDVETGRPTPPFGGAYHFGSMFVAGDTMSVFCVDKPGGSVITRYMSSDLKSWESVVAWEHPEWKIYQTSVCRGGDGFVMALELGGPQEVTGVRNTVRFLSSDDLACWEVLPETQVFGFDRFIQSPWLTFSGGWYYLIVLEEKKDDSRNDYLTSYEPRLYRSRDLADWTEARRGLPELSPVDMLVGNPLLSQGKRQEISRSMDYFLSDVDFAEYEGRTKLFYTWNDRLGSRCTVEGESPASLETFLGEGF